MCSEAVYGSDVDMMGWDFCMTDRRAEWRLLHFGYRTARMANRPAFIAVHMGGRTFRSRLDRLRELEYAGIPVFYTSTSDFDPSKHMMKQVPDTLGMSEDDISKLPDHVRSFKCSGQIEKGQPHCQAEKYNEFVCPARKGKASWHPGVYVLI